MSYQPRIDDYYKSTSGNKRTIKSVKLDEVSKRTNLTNYFRTKNGTRGRNSKVVAKVGKEKASFCCNSQNSSIRDVISLDSPSKSNDSSFRETSLLSSRKFGQSPTDKLRRQIEKSFESKNQSVSLTNVTPKKSKIASFAMACNSAPSIPSKGRISLKKRKKDCSTTSSLPNKSSMKKLHEIPNDDGDEIEIIERTSCSETRTYQNFSINSEPEIVVVNEKKDEKSLIQVENFENSPTFSGEIKNNVTPKKRQCENFDGEMQNGDSRAKRKNVVSLRTMKLQDNCGDSSNAEINDKSSSRNNENLLPTRNSPSTSGWSVKFAIEPSVSSMTALSIDWKNTLDKSINIANSTEFTPQSPTKKIRLSMSLNAKHNVNSSKKSNSSIKHSLANEKNENCSTPLKISPRRVLFSPEISPKNVHSIKKSNSNFSKSETFETNNSKGVLKGSNLIENNSSNQPGKNDENLTLAQKSNESQNSSIERKNTIISPTKMNESSKSPTKNFVNSSLRESELLRTPKKNSPLGKNESTNSQKKIAQLSNSPTISQTSPDARQNFQSPSRVNELLATPTKRRKLSFSPKVKHSPKKFFKERVDTDLATRAIENLNQAKQGIIPMNDFDLELIYEKKSFIYEYGCLKTDATIKYEAKDVNIPEDKHGDHLFMVITNVFAEPMNCGYFNEEERDRIFSILTLSCEAQSLLARMLKRKRGWHRTDGIKYAEISNNLKPIFQELVRCKILDDDIAKEDTLRLLNLLQVDEIRIVCQAMKVNHKGAKAILIGELVKLAGRKNSLFPGMKSPSLALKEKIVGVLGICIRLLDDIENLLKRIFTLLIPNQDPKENMAEAFRMLVLVHYGDVMFPVTPKERFPIFRNREQLISYTEAKSAWTQIFNASEAKDWETVRMLGQLASDRLKMLFQQNNVSDETNLAKLPSHVKQFEAHYPWTKVLWKSVEGFKKTKDGIETAANYLQSLVRNRKKISGNFIRWYSELALIEMHHRKNLEISAEITIEALMHERLSENDIAAMSDRARKLLDRSKNISSQTKERLLMAIQPHQEMLLSIAKPMENVIEATMVQGNTTGSKSTWSVGVGGDVSYLRVEQVALLHYSGKGFHNGLHCEGSLPVTLFAVVFWNEIYEISVPGAFVSPYQNAPLDLYTSRFLDHRRERIEAKLTIIRQLNHEELSEIMCEDFEKYRNYTSLMHGKLFQEAEDFKDFIECLGTSGVVGICERMASNYTQWKSGFPDLAVWDSINKKCKFVEVKGPGDTLSTKQKLWIQFLKSLDVGVEVCIVKGTTRKYAV